MRERERERERERQSTTSSHLKKRDFWPDFCSAPKEEREGGSEREREGRERQRETETERDRQTDRHQTDRQTELTTS